METMQNKPVNLIILCSDEMRGDCLGVMGNPDIKTPNLDRLAQHSVLFKNHFTCHGKCVPSRVALMTGRYSHTDGMRDIFNDMPEDTPNVLGRLKELGYQSAVFGKNHCWRTMFSGYVDVHSWTGEYEDYYDMRQKEAEEINKNMPPPPCQFGDGFDYVGRQLEVTDEIYAEQVATYLTQTRDKDRPFFMQVNYEAPHPVYRVEDPYFSMYSRDAITPFPYDLPKDAPLPLRVMREVRTGNEPNEAAFREIQATYYGMITKVDTLVGKIMQTVRDEGLLENTLILFWVDHGDFAGQYGLVEKWDTCMNDCIMHVPSMMYSPTLPAGKVVDSLTSHVDLAPTIFDVMGIEPIRGIHGRSLVPLMLEDREVRTAIFGDGGHESEATARAKDADFKRKTGKDKTYLRDPDTMARTKMVRTKDYKMVIRLAGGNELYDVVTDPYEMENLWDAEGVSSIKMDLMQRMLDWCLETDPDKPYLQQIRA